MIEKYKSKFNRPLKIESRNYSNSLILKYLYNKKIFGNYLYYNNNLQFSNF